MTKEKKLNILSIDCDWVISLRHQEDLLSFTIPLLFKHENIILDYSHDKIYTHFTHNYDEYNLYNIDHHHDYAYCKYETLDEGNWLYHLSNIFLKKINYIWINNPESEHPSHLNMEKIREKLRSYKFDQRLNFIPQQTFDKIFVCCSPEYNTKVGITTFKIIERLINDNKKSNT